MAATATSWCNGPLLRSEQWFGPRREGFQTFAAAFHAARTDAAEAGALLAAVAADGNAPAVARASALSELASRVRPGISLSARTGLADPDPMVRIGALDMLESLPAGPDLAARLPAARPIPSAAASAYSAASLLAPVPAASQPSARSRPPRPPRRAEFIAAQRLQRRAAGSRARRSASFHGAVAAGPPRPRPNTGRR